MTKVVPLAMRIETILISNLDHFDSERNALMITRGANFMQQYEKSLFNGPLHY